MELGSLASAIDELAELGAGGLGDGETVAELLRQLSRLECVASQAAAAFDASREWSAVGARSAPAWLAVRTRLPRAECDRRVRLGRAVRHLPHAEAAWQEGQIGGAHVGTLGSLHHERTEAALARDEEMLVGLAGTLRYGQFCRAIAYWQLRNDPDGADESDEARRNRRDAYLSESFGGMFLGKITLDPLSGAIVSGELSRIYDEMFRADWAEAKVRLGGDPTVADLPRTPAQRRADALVEMARRSAATPPGARRPAPLFSVLVGYETLHGLICELASGQVVSPRSLVPWLSEAYIERAVFGLANRVEVSESARLFRGATRRAIELRDGECFHPYCEVRADRCQVDHIIPYPEGGPTTQENGRMACGFHNRARHQRPPPRAPDP